MTEKFNIGDWRVPLTWKIDWWMTHIGLSIFFFFGLCLFLSIFMGTLIAFELTLGSPLVFISSLSICVTGYFIIWYIHTLLLRPPVTRQIYEWDKKHWIKQNITLTDYD